MTVVLPKLTSGAAPSHQFNISKTDVTIPTVKESLNRADLYCLLALGRAGMLNDFFVIERNDLRRMVETSPEQVARSDSIQRLFVRRRVRRITEGEITLSIDERYVDV